MADLPTGVEIRTFVSAARGSTAFSTGLATFKPGASLPCHQHAFSEAVTIVEGEARLQIEGRTYHMRPRDCVHIPARVPHSVLNEDPVRDLITHSAFASAQPNREAVNREFRVEDRGFQDPFPDDAETIVRFDRIPAYELSAQAFFTDLFARRLGAVGICGGYGRFLPGASLPCHIHDYDESITIVKGAASCLVEGRRYELSDCATAYIPKGLPHRFLNTSQEEMAMIWVYAGDEPDRRIVDGGFCSGALSWAGIDFGREK
ncbi:MAG TPA: cupin domain-containing protein [Acidobacteriaceae bacterium]|nr:cupin domain-containing protein [Acidobacteriaceae bacterium]